MAHLKFLGDLLKICQYTGHIYGILIGWSVHSGSVHWRDSDLGNWHCLLEMYYHGRGAFKRSSSDKPYWWYHAPGLRLVAVIAVTVDHSTTTHPGQLTAKLGKKGSLRKRFSSY